MPSDTDRRKWIDTKALEIYEAAKGEIYYLDAMKQALDQWHEAHTEPTLFDK